MDFLYKVRWLNGPLAGRELDLPTGETRLGGVDADIALTLEESAETVLSVSAEGITLSPAVPVWVDGLPWDTTQPLPLERVIDLAGQGLIFGQPDSTLSTAPLPPRGVAEPEKNQSRLWPLWIGLSLTLIALVVVVIAILRHPLENKETFDAHHWLEQTLREPQYAGLQAQIDEKGMVHLSGLTPSSENIVRLRQQLQQHHLLFRDESLGADSLRNLVRQVLMLNGYHEAEVNSGPSLDSVEIHGAIEADAVWQRTSARLHEIKQLKHWQVINDRAELFQSLLELLSQQNLLEGISVSIVGKELLISGKLDKPGAEKMAKVLRTFNLEKQSRLKARFQNIPSKVLAANILPAAVMSVGGNARSVYLQLTNGMRLQQGAILPSGYKIFALSHNAVTFLRGQQLISIPIHL